MPRSKDLTSYSPQFYTLTESAFLVSDRNAIVWTCESNSLARTAAHDWYGWRTALRTALSNGNVNVLPILGKANCVRISRRGSVLWLYNQFDSSSYNELNRTLTERASATNVPTITKDEKSYLAVAPQVIASPLAVPLVIGPDKMDSIVEDYLATTPLEIRSGAVAQQESAQESNEEQTEQKGSVNDPKPAL